VYQRQSIAAGQLLGAAQGRRDALRAALHAAGDAAQQG
jgi:hypothetical protein